MGKNLATPSTGRNQEEKMVLGRARYTQTGNQHHQAGSHVEPPRQAKVRSPKKHPQNNKDRLHLNGTGQKSLEIYL